MKESIERYIEKLKANNIKIFEDMKHNKTGEYNSTILFSRYTSIKRIINRLETILKEHE